MRMLTLGTFLLGTAIFTAYYYFGQRVLLIGYAYIIVAFLVNISLAIVGFAMAVKERNRKLFLSTGIMMLNIPVAIFYVWFTFKLMDTARVTFINDTGVDLVDLKLTGCEDRIIPDLEAGASETVWITIPHDCSLELRYLLNGKEVRGSVSGYLTPGMGDAMDYRIRK